MADFDKLKKRMDIVLPAEEMEVIDTLATLHAERLKQGLSQRELADRIGMKQPQLAKIERLDSVPSFATLNRYAAGLGLKLKLSVIA
jgi:ribosome-binding protein aMBF1 (putative translation factor)